jgi:hypothetical protein
VDEDGLVENSRRAQEDSPEKGVRGRQMRVFHRSRNRQLLTRRMGWIAVFTFIFLFLDWLVEPGISPFHVIFVLGKQMGHEHIQDFLTALARLLGVILATSVTLCGIAIPLTANNYTPKLISLFVNDRVNWAMFGLLVTANLMTHWTILACVDGNVPYFNVLISSTLGFLSLLFTVPYAYYVFRVLLPETIVSHIEREIIDDLNAMVRSHLRDDPREVRARVFENIKYISNIVLRSIDRHDRDTALYSLETLRHISDHYSSCKAQMPLLWFEVDQEDFLSKPPEVLKQITDSGTIFEVELLEECALILSVAIGCFREGVRMLGVTVRHVGECATERGDEGTAEMARIYFNSFIRAAISRRNPDAIYMLIFQYRLLAESMLHKSPKHAVQVAFFLDYYGHQAVRTGIVFVANLIAYDLVFLVIRAYEEDASCRRELFELFLNFDRNDTLRNFPGVIKSHVKLMVNMHARGCEDESRALLAEFKHVEESLLRAAIEEVESVKDPFFWEITDRRRHLDYVEPTDHEHFSEVKNRILALYKT